MCKVVPSPSLDMLRTQSGHETISYTLTDANPVFHDHGVLLFCCYYYCYYHYYYYFWHLKIVERNITWVQQNLDNLVNSHFWSWFEIPVTRTLDIISLSHKNYGLDIQKLSKKFTQRHITFQFWLRNSKKPSIWQLFKKTSKTIRYNTILTKIPGNQ